MSAFSEKLRYIFCCGFRKKQEKEEEFGDIPNETPKQVEMTGTEDNSDDATSSSTSDDSPTTTIHDDIVIVED